MYDHKLSESELEDEGKKVKAKQREKYIKNNISLIMGKAGFIVHDEPHFFSLSSIILKETNILGFVK